MLPPSARRCATGWGSKCRSFRRRSAPRRPSSRRCPWRRRAPHRDAERSRGCLSTRRIARLRRVRELTDRAFGVNLVLAFPIDGLLDACLEERVPILSTFWGDPDAASDRIHAGEALHLHTVGTVDEARRAVAAGVDVVVAQGWEAGGHVTGRIPTMALTPAVVDAVAPVLVVAAGGIREQTRTCGRAHARCAGGLAGNTVPHGDRGVHARRPPPPGARVQRRRGSPRSLLRRRLAERSPPSTRQLDHHARSGRRLALRLRRRGPERATSSLPPATAERSCATTTCSRCAGWRVTSRRWRSTPGSPRARPHERPCCRHRHRAHRRSHSGTCDVRVTIDARGRCQRAADFSFRFMFLGAVVTAWQKIDGSLLVGQERVPDDDGSAADRDEGVADGGASRKSCSLVAIAHCAWGRCGTTLGSLSVCRQPLSEEPRGCGRGFDCDSRAAGRCPSPAAS